VQRENLAFLAAGLAFGMLLGFAVYHAVATAPDPHALPAAQAAAEAPRGPQAPTAMGGPNVDGGAPMLAEINRLKRVLQDEPESPAALLRLANLYQDAAMLPQAIDYYERYLKVRSDDANVLTDLGICYRGVREFERAIELFAEAQRVDPRHWQSLFNTVVVAVFDLGQLDRASTALQSIEAIDPPPPDLDRARIEQLRQALDAARARNAGGA
jgi:tetratricopeptide (TPR) repeat protein